MSGIRLSEKHGVNPSMGICFYCGEDDGTIALPGRLRGDAEAPRRAVWSMEPCRKCKDWMKQGVMVIEATGDADAPCRTGRLWVLKDDAIKRIFNPGMAEQSIRRRCAFIDPDAAKLIGLGATD